MIAAEQTKARLAEVDAKREVELAKINAKKEIEKWQRRLEVAEQRLLEFEGTPEGGAVGSTTSTKEELGKKESEDTAVDDETFKTQSSVESADVLVAEGGDNRLNA